MSRVWLITFLLIASLTGFCQETRSHLSVDFKDQPLEVILDSITYKTGYFFSYNADAIPEGSLYTLKRSAIHIDSLVSLLLIGTKLEYLKEDDQIIIRKLPQDFSYKVINEGNKKSTLKGWVRHQDDDEPVVGANVFLNGTTIGGVTDKNGNYTIREVPPGTHQLVISHIGYETNAYQIKAYDGNTYVLNSFLKLKTQELPSLEIISKPLVDSSEWRTHYRTFETEFIGYSYNASRCKILNPEVLNFTYDKKEDRLKAYVEEPLIIENRALGYLISCQIESFEKLRSVTRFHIRARFENMDYRNRRVKRRWKRNRKITYEGSSTHFFRSLIADKHRREGFRTFFIGNNTYVEAKRDDLIKKDEHGYNWVLAFDSTLTVHYLKETESPEYLEYLHRIENSTGDELLNYSKPNNEPGVQVSVVELLKNQVILFSNGQVESPEDIVRLGYWSWERTADLMPINYDPKNDDF